MTDANEQLPTEAELKAIRLSEEKKEADRRRFYIYSNDGDLLHTATQEEFDDIVFNVCAFGADSRTFTAHNGKLQLTFTTINENINETILKEIQEYVRKESPSQALLERKSKKVNLCHQLQSIQIDATMVNLREQKPEDRQKYFDAMAKQQIDYYGLYLWAFEELIRRALLDGEALGNS